MPTGDLFNSSSAEISACRKYRYTLWRWWDEVKPYVMFIGLNPSTADEVEDDPTIRRCISFAKSWGYGGLCMANLFALRATAPADMREHQAPVGIDNNMHLITLAEDAAIVVAAWGVNGTHINRDKEVRALIKDMYYLEITKDGHPRHPLYIKADTKPKLWGNQ